MDERRAGLRTRSLLRGKIVFNHRQSTLDCVIRNISDVGARLSASEAVSLPQRFELQIPLRGVTLQARIEWRSADEVGVAFETATASEGAPPADLQGKLAVLEAENRLLRQQLATARAASAAQI